LESLKEKFKLLAQLWVEVNYTVSAFDEINMCKMRIQVVNSPEEITEEDSKFKLKILRCEIPEQLQIFIGQKAEAEINFVRLNGRLKYLEHLKEQNQPKVCPICTNQTKERYYVTICGHSICDECFLMMVKNRNKLINCPVCRTKQETREVLAVNNDTISNSEPINGTYSPKIDQIIRCILSLRKRDSDVKIILFTHWDSIINAIIPALNANGINYRSSTNSNFPKQVQEFKDYSNDVTCMLLNLKFGGKGLNLIEATHVFLIEPILNADDEFQAIGRVHRIGQTRETFVHRFITKDTIEETIYCKITREMEKWTLKHFTIRDLEELFDVDKDDESDHDDDDTVMLE
jgi:E3 ubiquitin-protein ligase SHPRH